MANLPKPRTREAFARELDQLEHAFGSHADVRAAIAAEYLHRGMRGGAIATDAEAELSDRERAVLIRYALGCSNKSTANELGIGIRTLETYLKRGRAKLELRSREACVRFGIASGWFA